jgi:hypothetical protein
MFIGYVSNIFRTRNGRGTSNGTEVKSREPVGGGQGGNGIALILNSLPP